MSEVKINMFKTLPGKTASPGSKHFLIADTVGEREFYWTGTGWSANQNLQWQTDPNRMRVLGWKYSRPSEKPKDQTNE
jgi:hypothetical protein